MKKKISILIIEDNESDANLYVRCIGKSGFDVAFERVETVEELKKALTEQTWNVVLSDYSLPYLSAPIALEIFKSFNLNIPFILISGAVGEETAVSLIKQGAHDYLMKQSLHRLPLVIKHEMEKALQLQDALAGAIDTSIASDEAHCFFRSNLHHLLEVNNLKQAQLARDVGISKQTLSDWLRRDSLINIQQAVKIAKYFQITTDELVTYDLKNIKNLDNLRSYESLNKLRSPFYIVGPDGGVQFVNQSFCDLVGFSQEDLNGRAIFEIIHPESCLHLDVLKKRAHENKIISSETEVKYVVSDAGYRWIHHLVVRNFADSKIFIFLFPAGNQKNEKLIFLNYSLEQAVMSELGKLRSMSPLKKDVEFINRLDLKNNIRVDINILGCLLRSLFSQIEQIDFENASRRLKVVLTSKDEGDQIFLNASVDCSTKTRATELTLANKIASMINAKIFESYSDKSYLFGIAFQKK